MSGTDIGVATKRVVAILLGGAAMAELFMSIGKLLTMYVSLPIIALLLLTLIGVVVNKDDNNG